MTTAEDGAVSIEASATDPEGHTLTYSATQPQHGTVTGSGPSFSYTPNANFSGTDQFTISVSDGTTTVEIPVVITVTAANDAPVAADQQVAAFEGVAVDVTLAATDVDSPELTYTLVTQPAHGTVTGTAPHLVYTADAEYLGDDTLTFQANDGALDSNVATVTFTVTAPPVCGDGHTDPGEDCDDGNTDDNDGCGHSCKTEGCGDGLVQFALGESCDDGNHTDNDGCDATCHVEPFSTTEPVKISGDLSCTTSVANAARKVAVDGSGTIYAVMKCGDSADVAISTDRGQTFSAPLDLSSAVLPPTVAPTSVSQVAVASGPSGVAYVAMMLNTGTVYLRTTEDRGATWSDAALVGTAQSTSAGLSLQSFNDDVYIGFSTAGGVAVARNHQRGSGAFDLTTVTMGIAFFDLLYDIVQGTLVVAADTPGFHIRASSDAGVTFATEVNPAGSEFYSDWAIGNGRIYVSGTNGAASASLYVIHTNDLTTSSSVSGLPVVSASQTRTVAADAAGNAYAGSQLDAGGIQLDRLAVDATAFDAPRSINATGSSPIVTPLPGNQGAAVVYTDGTSVYATMQVYP